MKILGISGSLNYPKNHDSSAALVVDGKLIANYEDERFTGSKHSVDFRFPTTSIRRILKENNLKLDDIDYIGIPHDPKFEEEYRKRVALEIDPEYTKAPKLLYQDHHMAHLCDALFQSGFNHCACLITDGMGDSKDSITLAQYKDGKINILKKYLAAVSPGIMYSSASYWYTNMGEFAEGKLMGLAPYGKPTEKMPLYMQGDEIVADFPAYINTDGLTMHEFSQYEFIFDSYFRKNCYPYRARQEEHDNIMHYANLAASVQDRYESIILHIVKYLKDITNEDNLVMSGGCIQNCICNNKIVELGLFKDIYASPAPHDAGCGAGLAFYGAYINGEKIENKRRKNSYTGKTYSNDEILKACEGLTVTEYDQTKVARDLKNSKIFAWFQGGSELGPRALGHRSLIADPSNRSNLFILNDNLKHRENWRPLAPSIPEELFDKVFDTPNHQLCEFMLRTLIIKPEFRKKMIAVCHVDNSTRPQCLERDQNPEYYDLMMEFYKISGVPGIINTSFNDRGQPIIETPETAIKFLKEHPDLHGIIFNAKYVVTR